MKNLENTVKKLLQLLEHYGPAERDKIALLLSQVFIQRLGVPPENVFGVLLNDVMVAKGTSLSFLTCLFRAWLADSTLDELIAVLRRARVEDRLLEFFPQQRRTAEAFQAHFAAEGLDELVVYSRKRFSDARAKELREALSDLISDGGAVGDALDLLKAKRAKDGGLPDGEAVGAVWEALLGSVDTANKNSPTVIAAVVKQLRAWAKLLAAATGGKPKAQADLLSRIQTSCYDDPALLKSFSEIVRHLYDKDVLGEEVVRPRLCQRPKPNDLTPAQQILAWVKRGTNPKGRAVFVKDLEKFVAWLQEAEEESDGEAPPAPVIAAANVASA